MGKRCRNCPYSQKTGKEIKECAEIKRGTDIQKRLRLLIEHGIDKMEHDGT